MRKVSFNEQVEYNIGGKIVLSSLTNYKPSTNYFYFMSVAADMDFSLTEMLYMPIYSKPYYNEKIEFETDSSCN